MSQPPPNAMAGVEASSAPNWLWPRRGHNGLPLVHWRASDLIVGVLSLLGLRVLMVVLERSQEAVPTWAVLLLGGALPLVFIAAFPVWAYLRGGGGRPIRWPPAWRWMLEGVIALPVMLLTVCGVAVLSIAWRLTVDEAPQMEERMQTIATSQSSWLLAVFALAACVWAPLAEELFCRGFLQNALARRMPVAAAAAVQTTLFALAHPYGGLNLLAILFVGGVLTAHYLWRKTLIATMILHAMFNGLMTLIVAGVMIAMSHAPVLGVQLDARASECRVTAVYEGSGADKAGLAGGDLIVEFDGRPVESAQSLQLEMLNHQPGDSVSVVIERDGRRMQRILTLSPREGLNTLIREAHDDAR